MVTAHSLIVDNALSRKLGAPPRCGHSLNNKELSEDGMSNNENEELGGLEVCVFVWGVL